jgi:hypothetical protein
MYLRQTVIFPLIFSLAAVSNSAPERTWTAHEGRAEELPPESCAHESANSLKSSR